MQRDFYWEFIEEVDLLLKQFIKTARTININSFDVNGVNIEKAVRNFLWVENFLYEPRAFYNEQRLAGVAREVVLAQIWETVFVKKLPKGFESINHLKTSWQEEKSDYYFSLKELEERVLIYCKNYRQLCYYLPFLQQTTEQVILLVDFQISETVGLGDWITVLEFDIVMDEVCVDNEYLKQHFELIYEYSNTFLILLTILRPKTVLVLEGCHEEMEILAAIAKKLMIPSICIQQGWPSIMTTRFRDMGYDFYLTWGRAFSRLWGAYNTNTTFVDVGYMYEVPDEKKEVITFFLQAPVITLNEIYFNEFLEFIIYCAFTFEKKILYVKEHPEYRLSADQQNKLTYCRNIRLVNDMPLAKLFAITDISVSAFSSTLMESVIHNAIPFVFNPSSTPRFYPDLEKEGFGVYANSLEAAKIKIKELLGNEEMKSRLNSKLIQVKPTYFTNAGVKTVRNILDLVLSVSQ